MFIYIIPIIVCIITSILMYSISNNPEKSEMSTVLGRNVLPGVVMGLLVFVIIKYKDSQMFNPEPMMYGNYFD